MSEKISEEMARELLFLIKIKSIDSEDMTIFRPNNNDVNEAIKEAKEKGFVEYSKVDRIIDLFDEEEKCQKITTDGTEYIPRHFFTQLREITTLKVYEDPKDQVPIEMTTYDKINEIESMAAKSKKKFYNGYMYLPIRFFEDLIKIAREGLKND